MKERVQKKTEGVPSDEILLLKQSLDKMSPGDHVHVYRIINYYAKDSRLQPQSSSVMIDLKKVSPDCLKALKLFIKDTTMQRNANTQKSVPTTQMATSIQNRPVSLTNSVPQVSELFRGQRTLTPLQKQIKKRLKELKVSQTRYKKPSEADQRIILSDEVDGVDNDDDEGIIEEDDAFEQPTEEFGDDDLTTPSREDDDNGDLDLGKELPDGFDDETVNSIDQGAIEEEINEPCEEIGEIGDEKSEAEDLILCGNDDIVIDLGKHTTESALLKGMQVLQSHGFAFGEVEASATPSIFESDGARKRSPSKKTNEQEAEAKKVESTPKKGSKPRGKKVKQTPVNN
jgi:hypothetical protein